MILGGDELSHTQNGNNNAYCQDNELTWLNWDLDPRQKSFLDFVKTCARIWREQPVLQRRAFFLGRPIRGSAVKDLTFFDPNGNEMSDEDWNNPDVQCIGVRLAGDLIQEVDERGQPLRGDTLLLLLNSNWQEQSFQLPVPRDNRIWERLIDTAHPDESHTLHKGRDAYRIYGRSMAVLRTTLPADVADDFSRQQEESLRGQVDAGLARPLVH
jgi:glycogen operon protein